MLLRECETLHEGNGLPAEHIRNSSVVFLLHDAMRVYGTRKKEEMVQCLFHLRSSFGVVDVAADV